MSPKLIFKEMMRSGRLGETKRKDLSIMGNCVDQELLRKNLTD